MNFPSKAALMLAPALAALSLCSAAIAQDQPAPPPAGDMHHHGADHAEWRKAHEERRARFLHDVLNIHPDQETAFQAFLADMRRPMRDHKDGADRKAWTEHKDAGAASLTTPERLDKMSAFMSKRMAERQAAFQHRADAIRRFYAVLSPEQKRAFDALHDRGGMDGHGGRGFERHGGGPDDHRGGPEDHEHGEMG
jgi:Spy/CpxP family protein refolding chaperone